MTPHVALLSPLQRPQAHAVPLGPIIIHHLQVVLVRVQHAVWIDNTSRMTKGALIPAIERPQRRTGVRAVRYNIDRLPSGGCCVDACHCNGSLRAWKVCHKCCAGQGEVLPCVKSAVQPVHSTTWLTCNASETERQRRQQQQQSQAPTTHPLWQYDTLQATCLYMLP
jgi:hypothetical protein